MNHFSYLSTSIMFFFNSSSKSCPFALHFSVRCSCCLAKKSVLEQIQNPLNTTSSRYRSTICTFSPVVYGLGNDDCSKYLAFVPSSRSPTTTDDGDVLCLTSKRQTSLFNGSGAIEISAIIIHSYTRFFLASTEEGLYIGCYVNNGKGRQQKRRTELKE